MTRITTARKRPYRTDLRTEQSESTRTRILDAALVVIGDGWASVSIPAVAREAGVSVPTIYRHFSTKAELLAAVYPHALRRAGLQRPVPPRSMDELRDRLHAFFDYHDGFDDLARVAMAMPAAEEVRRLSMPERLAAFRRLTDSIEPPLAEVDRDRVVHLLIILTSSATVRVLRDHLELSVEQAADEVDWMVRAAVAAASSKQ